MAAARLLGHPGHPVESVDPLTAESRGQAQRVCRARQFEDITEGRSVVHRPLASVPSSGPPARVLVGDGQTVGRRRARHGKGAESAGQALFDPATPIHKTTEPCEPVSLEIHSTDAQIRVGAQDTEPTP